LGKTVERVEVLTGDRRVTVGTNKNYGTKGFVEAVFYAKAAPYVAQNATNCSSAIDGRTTRHA